MKFVRILLVIALALAAATAFARPWNDKWGKTYQANFVRFFDGCVVLQQGKKVLKIPFEELSDEDQQYVRELLESKGQGHLLPPKQSEAEDELRLSKPGPPRTWTNENGREIEAQLLGFKGDGVILLFKGREVTVPVDKLCPEDRRHVEEEKNRAKGQGNPPTGPPAAAQPPAPMPHVPMQPPSFPQPPRMPPPSVPRMPDIPTPSFPEMPTPRMPDFPRPNFPQPTLPQPTIPQPSWPQGDQVPLFGPRPGTSPPSLPAPYTPGGTAAAPRGPLTAEQIGWLIVYLVVGDAIGTVIGAVILQAACLFLNTIAGGPRGRNTVQMPDFGMAAGISLVIILINNGLTFLMRLLVGYGALPPLPGILLLCAISIAAGVSIIASSLQTSVFKAIVIIVLGNSLAV